MSRPSLECSGVTIRDVADLSGLTAGDHRADSELTATSRTTHQPGNRCNLQMSSRWPGRLELTVRPPLADNWHS
jgi:hypothetical protein